MDTERAFVIESVRKTPRHTTDMIQELVRDTDIVQEMIGDCIHSTGDDQRLQT